MLTEFGLSGVYSVLVIMNYVIDHSVAGAATAINYGWRIWLIAIAVGIIIRILKLNWQVNSQTERVLPMIIHSVNVSRQQRHSRSKQTFPLPR